MGKGPFFSPFGRCDGLTVLSSPPSSSQAPAFFIIAEADARHPQSPRFVLKKKSTPSPLPQVPVFFIITKVDMSPDHVTKQTVADLCAILRKPGVRKRPFRVATPDDVFTCAAHMAADALAPMCALARSCSITLSFLSSRARSFSITLSFLSSLVRSFFITLSFLFSRATHVAADGGAVASLVPFRAPLFSRSLFSLVIDVKCVPRDLSVPPPPSPPFPLPSLLRSPPPVF